MKKSFAAFFISTLLASSTAWAEEDGFISLGVLDRFSFFVGAGSHATRVGNSVLTYVHQISPQRGVSKQILFACDGAWQSDHLRLTYVSNGALSPQEYESQARAERSDPPLDYIRFIEWGKSERCYSPALRSQLQALCKGASPEPKNVRIPIAEFQEAGIVPGGSIAILTGTVIRRKTVIDAWTRTSHFRLKPALWKGKPWVKDGVVQKIKVPTGTYAMERTAFDCASNSTFTYQLLEYNKDGTILYEAIESRSAPKFVNVVPDSVGEMQLDAICKIY